MSMQVEPVAGAVVTAAEQPLVVVVDKALVARLVGDAQRQGLSVDGEGGLLAQLIKPVVESALEGGIQHQPRQLSEQTTLGINGKTLPLRVAHELRDQPRSTTRSVTVVVARLGSTPSNAATGTAAICMLIVFLLDRSYTVESTQRLTKCYRPG